MQMNIKTQASDRKIVQFPNYYLKSLKRYNRGHASKAPVALQFQKYLDHKNNNKTIDTGKNKTIKSLNIYRLKQHYCTGKYLQRYCLKLKGIVYYTSNTIEQHFQVNSTPKHTIIKVIFSCNFYETLNVIQCQVNIREPSVTDLLGVFPKG